MYSLKLNYNYGYKWFRNKNVFVKGYAFYKGILYEEKTLAELFFEASGEGNFESLLRELNGIFAVIKDDGDSVMAAVDITRTFPLFYSTQNNFHISDDAFYLREKLGLDIDKNTAVEFLRCGYVPGKNTLLKGLFQLQAGEFLKADENGVKTKMYHNYLAKKTEINYNQYDYFKTKVHSILDAAITRLEKFANDDFIVVPLSGGYDSRSIVALLKMHNFRNVLCYTYGRPESPEVSISKKVASKLKYEWHFVNYSNELIKDNFLETNWFYELYKYAFNYVSTIHLQDLFAFKTLHDSGLIPDNSIVVPGHTGDFLSGGHLRKLPVPNRHNLMSIIMCKHFTLNEDKDGNLAIEKNLKRYVESCPDFLPYSIDDNWNLKERQSKYIINSNRTYEFFGYRHAIPLWDLELVEFFRKLPPEYKIEKPVYEASLIDCVFRPLDVNFIKKKTIKSSKFFKNLRYLVERTAPYPAKTILRDLLWKDINNMELILKPIIAETKRKWSYSESVGIVAEWCIKKVYC